MSSDPACRTAAPPDPGGLEEGTAAASGGAASGGAAPARRVLFLISSFFPKPRGATFSAFRLAQALRARGTHITFLVEEEGQGWTKGGTYQGFPVRSFTLSRPGKGRKLRGLRDFTRFALAQRGAFDLLHIHGGSYVNLLLGWWFSTITGRKALLKITLDGWDSPDGVRRQKYGRLNSLLYRKLDAVVAMTSGQAVRCRGSGYRGPVAAIPNGVDCDRFAPVDDARRRQIRAQLGVPAEATVLLFAGVFQPRKGVDVLFRVWQELRRQFTGLALVCVGDLSGADSPRERLAEYLAGEGLPAGALLSEEVKVYGLVPDMERYMQAADVLVFPSRQEGFGTVQIEAMACGLPCVVNDLPGVSEDIFPNEAVGYRIAGNRVADYVRTCSALIAQPEARERTGRAARQFVLSRFSVGAVADRYLRFYEQVLAGPARPGAG